MPDSNTYRIEDFVADLTRVSFSDILVNVKPENNAVFLLDETLPDSFEIPFTPRLNQLYKIAVQNKKTADIQSLCLADGLFTWTYKENAVPDLPTGQAGGRQEIRSPLVLVPVHVSLNKIKKSFQIRLQPESAFINPFLLSALAHEYQIQTDDFGHKELKTQVDTLLTRLKNQEFPYQIMDFKALGNFHHHRYEIIRDLEELASLPKPGYLVQLLLGQTDASLPDWQEKQEYTINLTTQNCFSSDTDQEEIIEQINSGNCVIQGPPGTGKSQVLSNLLTKLLHRGNMHLLVSEKKTALDVLAQKLKSRGLGELAVVVHTQSQAGEFISQLKNCWKKLESERYEHKQNLLLSAQQLNRLQLLLDKLNQSALLEKYNLTHFQQFQESDVYAKLPYISALPDLALWEELKPKVHLVFESIKSVKTIPLIRQSVLQHYTNTDSHLRELSELYSKLNALIGFESLKELEELIKLSARVQLMENESGKSYSSLLKTPAQFKKFEKLKNQYRLTSERIKLLESELENWKTLPGKSEVESWKINLEQGNWFLKRKSRSEVRKHLKNATLHLETALANATLFHVLKNKQLDLLEEFQKMGINQLEHELEAIAYIAKQMFALEANELNQVEQLEQTTKQLLLQNASQLKALERKIRDFLDLDVSASIPESINELLQHLDRILPLKKALTELPNAVYKLFAFCENEAEMEAIVLKSIWVNFSSLFPEVANVTGKKLHTYLTQIIESEQNEQLVFAGQLLFERQQKFKNYHLLLSTPAAKLKGEQKELKTRLKNGKALLVKEFSKSKQHKSIRELLESDALLWIELLCPLFLCTPVMVSKNLPLQAGFFECLIFDEASQLILPKALAALHRAKRVVVAGDEQQMSPSSYFSGSLSAVDLLHQAGFYLPNFHLKHHYRSKHSGLISFSNRHFYNDELIAYPEPLRNKKPIVLHRVEDGVYENRQNITEAKAVALQIEKLLNSGKSIGVVAFSEQQLSCIWSQIKPEFHALIEEKMQKNRLFLKPLEQVQGEECDYLIISLGYAKNNEGNFHLRFGPLNQKSGVKRLNVLFTRAIEHIDFFSSVSSSDFTLTNNEAINLLRLYLAEIESETAAVSDKFPFGILPEIKDSDMKISKIYRQIPLSTELKTFHEVMTARSWAINYQL